MPDGGEGGAKRSGGREKVVGEHDADAGCDMLQDEPLSEMRDGGRSDSYEDRARAAS